VCVRSPVEMSRASLRERSLARSVTYRQRTVRGDTAPCRISHTEWTDCAPTKHATSTPFSSLQWLRLFRSTTHTLLEQRKDLKTLLERLLRACVFESHFHKDLQKNISHFARSLLLLLSICCRMNLCFLPMDCF